jgi:Ser/Thr protein kinase RdoA (MazF antagonist)
MGPGHNARVNSTNAHPYERLTPDLVLDAMASVGLYGDGRLTALSSYENRVYQAGLEEPLPGTDLMTVVLKFYRPERWSQAQILEEHLFAAELAADEVPMVAPLSLPIGAASPLAGSTLHQHGGFAFSVSPRRGGRRPELEDLDVLEWIGRFLARLHLVGARQAFSHRPTLDVSTFGQASRQLLLEGNHLPLDVASAWDRACQGALQVASGLWQQAGDVQQLRLHGDCHPGNILWTPEGSAGAGPHFVDLDDARMGPAIQDLWMLLSGERAQQLQQLGALLDGYEQLRKLDRRELTLIEVLRTLRLIHYSAWLAQRWADPIFPINFPWFGTRDYWQGQVDMLIEQTEAMQAPPLVA